MSWQGDLDTAMRGDATIAGLVGDRIYPDVVDGKTKQPYVLYEALFSSGTTSHDGNRNTEYPNIEITAFAKDKQVAMDIGDAIKSAIEGKTLAGTSELVLTFGDRSGQYAEQIRLYTETLEFTGHVKLN